MPACLTARPPSVLPAQVLVPRVKAAAASAWDPASARSTARVVAALQASGAGGGWARQAGGGAERNGRA